MIKHRWRSDVTVELLHTNQASDAQVAMAARVSTQGGGSRYDTSEVRGLINYLMANRHGSPFEHSVFTFYIEAPIFVWREFMRHRIASYNEESGRYKQLEPTFYIPSRDRNIIQEGKAGHYNFKAGTTDQHEDIERIQKNSNMLAYDGYMFLLKQGVAREVARMHLPLNIYSSAYVTLNARALMNFLSLRVKATRDEGAWFESYPQREIEMVAEKMEHMFSLQMPLTHGAFITKGRVAP